MNLLSDPTYVLDLVSRHYTISVTDLVGESRTSRSTRARQVAMYVLKVHGFLTNLEIGAALHRDHSTVSWGVQRVSRRLRADAVEREQLQDALADCSEPAIVLSVTQSTLVEARALVKRLEAIEEQLSCQVGLRRRVA